MNTNITVLANAVSAVLPEIVHGQNAIDLIEGFTALTESLQCVQIELDDANDAASALRSASRAQAQAFCEAGFAANIRCTDLRTDIGQSIVAFVEALMPKAKATYQKKIAQNVRKALCTGGKIAWKAAKGAADLKALIDAAYKAVQSEKAIKSCKDSVKTIAMLRDIAALNGFTLTEPDSSK